MSARERYYVLFGLIRKVSLYRGVTAAHIAAMGAGYRYVGPEKSIHY
jgi:hypothetical protein